MARARASALKALNNDVFLSAVASRTLQNAHRFAREYDISNVFTDYKKMANLDLDAILIETPNSSHFEILKWVLENDLDVLVEGPLCTCLSCAEKLIKLAEKAGAVVEVGYTHRYNQIYEKAKDIIDTCQIGDPIIAYEEAMLNLDPKSWYFSQEVSGGMPLTHISYIINPIRWLLGDPIMVSAQANKIVYDAPDMVTEETCAATFQFASGAIGSILATYVAPKNFPGSWALEIICSKGALIINRQELTIYRNEKVEVFKPSEWSSPLFNQMKAFVSCIRQRKLGRNPLYDELNNMKTIQAIVDSCRAKKFIPVF